MSIYRNTENAVFVTREREIAHILYNLGLPDWYSNVYRTLLVNADDGEYTVVYGFENNVVYETDAPDDLLNESIMRFEHNLTCENPKCETCKNYQFDPYTNVPNTEKWWYGLTND